MKIMMIAPTPFFADRGCHTRIYGEITALQRLGHEIILVTYGLGRDIEGVRTVRCFNFPWYKKLSAGPSVWKILLGPFLLFKAMETIRSFRPDLVHAHLHEGAFIARFCSYVFRKPQYVFDCQGSLSGELLAHRFVKEGSLLHRLFIRLERRINGWFPIITQSENLQAQLVRNGADPDRIVNAMDAVDTAMFYPRQPDAALAKKYGIDPARPRVIYMGLLNTYQGTDLMLEAFEKVKAKLPDVQFIVIGFPNREKYEKIAEERGIRENTVFIGKVPFESTPRYLSLAEVAVAPKISLSEGDGKLYNYMAMGQGIVAVERSVSREILEDTGLYAASGDAAQLADQLVRLLGDETLRSSLGKKARDRAVACLSTDRSAKKIDMFYQDIRLQKNRRKKSAGE